MSWMRIFWLLALSVAFVITSQAANDESTAPQKPLMMRGVFALTLDVPVYVKMVSNEVELAVGKRYPLLEIHNVVFHLKDGARLTAILNGSVLTPYTIDYDIHAAVFDIEGNLLGTAKTTCEIKKEPVYWIGLPVRPFRDFELDFGISKKYEKARYFSLVFSEPDVPSFEEQNVSSQ